VDKLGDAILAIFGAPEELKNEQVRRDDRNHKGYAPLTVITQPALAFWGLVGTNRSAPVQSMWHSQRYAVVEMFGGAKQRLYSDWS